MVSSAQMKLLYFLYMPNHAGKKRCYYKLLVGIKVLFLQRRYSDTQFPYALKAVHTMPRVNYFRDTKCP